MKPVPAWLAAEAVVALVASSSWRTEDVPERRPRSAVEWDCCLWRQGVRVPRFHAPATIPEPAVSARLLLELIWTTGAGRFGRRFMHSTFSTLESDGEVFGYWGGGASFPPEARSFEPEQIGITGIRMRTEWRIWQSKALLAFTADRNHSEIPQALREALDDQRALRTSAAHRRGEVRRAIVARRAS